MICKRNDKCLSLQIIQTPKPVPLPYPGPNEQNRDQSPAVVLVLRRDLTVRELRPQLGLPLALLLRVPVLPLADARLLLLQQHRQTGVGRPEEVDLAARAVVVVDAVRAAVDPRLGDVDGGGIGDGLALAGFEGDGDGLLLLGIGALDGAETHAGAHDGDVLSMLQVFEDVLGGLLLAKAHLEHGLVDVLAGDLARQRAQLLDRGLEPVRLGQRLAFRAEDLLGPGEPAAPAHLPDDHLALPAHAGLRPRIQHRLHVGPVALLHRVEGGAFQVLLLGGGIGGGLLPGSRGTSGRNQLRGGLVLGEDGVGTQGTLPLGRSLGPTGDLGFGGVGLAAEEEVFDGGQGGGGVGFCRAIVVVVVFGKTTRHGGRQGSARDIGKACPGWGG